MGKKSGENMDNFIGNFSLLKNISSLSFAFLSLAAA